MSNTATLKTVVHTYKFDMTTEAGAAGYAELRETLKAKGLEPFDAIGNRHDERLEGRTIELKTTCLFDNQWNSAPVEGVSDKGLRVFDWAEDCQFINGRRTENLRLGYWLEQTDEMKEIRANILKCGYCGKQEPATKGYVFCPHCLDSEYLKVEDLKAGATRMQPVSYGSGKWMVLTGAELIELMPKYKDAQLHGSTERGKARLAKKRADVEAKYKSDLHKTETEHNGLVWLMDNGVSTDNVIYYSHTDRWAFGCRTPITDAEMRSELIGILNEFPYAYDIIEKSKY